MLLTIHIQLHPDMPPAVQVAAVVAASDTRDYAMFIHRISADITNPSPPPKIHTWPNPKPAAAFSEFSLSFFFAGVQYQTPEQQDWLVKRLFEVDRRAGWATAGIIEGYQTT